ncbi:uncharacterized protein LOC131303792 isoform X1 [Rhododendron vialii]|uniref:uncharacterized protein LOC131303792 isoform X1 n=1 Tax=Rhododendron vialii TaxID=182163 RepID=UPI00265F7D2E|nr:uncharacterized protein LOC131303792 isoform X1 [Rhododendron vialii]XP_058186795.1 uncharacterized protein LOC131303792 isoform X1 [Rhododendron vialii]XP_058186796.1 uncharacterized protein LOC131303792 isoform X1 [Rhododendron vialii]XP_058186797.1 uncharacterized protein LOC131303792 isoform X1 [Rhododendron vialii]XP_058186798.1 uncharacterized protein LOC131303792 isoform X1 [Rhododendron vialii]XP_058186799.1 uncharacterized protein LOC131303792 isoform X1 [Rhododendron vialii]XP_05
MSRSGRTRSSKSDTKEDYPGDTQHGIRRRKPGDSFCYNKSQTRKHFPQLDCVSDSERNGVEYSNKSDREFPDAALAWNRDGSYSTKMSPGLEDRRQQYHSHSPRTGLGRSYGSRSRSRSPPGGLSRESGVHGRNNAAQTCRDFAAGRCRRGDHCPYLHQGDREYEDRRCTDEGWTNSWKSRDKMEDRREYLQSIGRSNDLCSDFIKGKCYKGKSCRFSHNVASGKDSGKEVFLGRENFGSRHACFDHSRLQEPDKRGDIPCIYFAVGNCRKGKFCRFSHDGKTENPNDKSQDDWRRPSSDSDVVEQTGEHLRQRGAILSDHAKLLEWDEDIYGKVGAHEHRDATYPRDGRWVGSFNIGNRSLGHPPNNSGAVDCNHTEYLQPNNRTTAGSGGVESNGAESWFADMEVSSPWNSRQSSGHVVKEESGQIGQTTFKSFQMYEQNITGEMLGQKHQAIAATPSMTSDNVYFHSTKVSREDAGSFATSDCPVSNVDPKYSAMEQNGHCSRECLQPKDESIASLVVCELKGAQDWFADMEVSSPWNPGQSSSCILKQDSGQIAQTTQSVVPTLPSLQTDLQVITGEMFGQKHQVVATIPPMVSGKSYFQLKPSSKEDPGSISSDYPVPSTFPGGQNQHTLPLYGPRGKITISAENRPLFEDGKSLGKPDAVSGNKSGLPTKILPTQNILSREQLSQFANLSALSQLHGNVHQLPHLGSVPNPPKSITNVSPSSVTGFDRQYDPLIDSIEPVQCHNNLTLGELLPSPSEGKVIVGDQREVPSKDLLSSPTVEGNNGTTVEESKKAQENGSLENVNGDGRIDEGEKKSNGKAIRAFKFALAEFVKEILKPKWKEGEINRESYKAIVKKVVDKVTGSVQGAHIPQSQEKIDNYLLSSKLKVTKLVEVSANDFCLGCDIEISAAGVSERNCFTFIVI